LSEGTSPTARERRLAPEASSLRRPDRVPIVLALAAVIMAWPPPACQSAPGDVAGDGGRFNGNGPERQRFASPAVGKRPPRTPRPHR
jgi:hypothetical protein